jgi:hypothetical protein
MRHSTSDSGENRPRFGVPLCGKALRVYRCKSDDMGSYECNVLQLVMRYLDVAQAHLIDHDMDEVEGIQNSRRALIEAQHAVNGLFQTQFEHSALGSLASTGQGHRAALGA